MANKLPWFTHDHDAHEDGWIRNLVRNQGHTAGWLWWVLVELHHKHGVGDVLKRDINDVARAALTSASVVVRVLTEMGTDYEGQTKVRWNLVGTELQLEIKKLRERQSKLKSKIPSTFRQHSSNLPIEGEREEERERHHVDAVAGIEDFQQFWTIYPRKVAKSAALKAWTKIKPGEIDAILRGVKRMTASPGWDREDMRYIPHGSTWLNGRRWEDEAAKSNDGFMKAEDYLILEGSQ